MAKRTTSPVLPITIKLLLLIVGIIGQCTTLGGVSFMSQTHWLYYTNQSNLWIMLVILALLPYDILALTRGADAPKAPNWLQKLRFVMTVAIALTFLVFSVLLTPELIAMGQSGYLFSVSNLCVHNLVPILAILDFCLYGYTMKTTGSTFLLGAIMPLCYAAFALTLSFAGINFGLGKSVPYFFFDYETYGWFTISEKGIGVVWWIVIIGLVVLAMSYGLIAVKHRRARAVQGVKRGQNTRN